MIVRFIVSSLAGGIVLFLLGFLIYGLFLEAWMRTQIADLPGMMKEEPDMIALAVFNLVLAGMIAFVAENWAKARNFVDGLKVGGVLIFFYSMSVNLSFTAFMNVITSISAPIVDVFAMTFMGTIAGGVIGIVLGKMRGSES
ncbi:MAG: DUF1761 family protein [Acidobacteria bacterium]|nr:MAG: DUF1761 family protein [Acidobacteriota bacterium]REK04054.1 MAG: DUF1761 family protein [Acidobacteriota bacterium]REK15216.1 MAG: DUF1761 family protein [Acidobacteriota bacterium]REK46306.1 MAG: DUF1761 family protein [Acidobacteriota bacterium]